MRELSTGGDYDARRAEECDFLMQRAAASLRGGAGERVRMSCCGKDGCKWETDSINTLNTTKANLKGAEGKAAKPRSWGDMGYGERENAISSCKRLLQPYADRMKRDFARTCGLCAEAKWRNASRFARLKEISAFFVARGLKSCYNVPCA